MSVRSAAESFVERWDREGIPKYTRTRSVIGFFRCRHHAADNPTDRSHAKGVERVVAALKARDLVECAVMHDGSGAEGFVEFLQRFWSCVFCFKVSHHRGKLRLSGGIYR